MCLGVSWQDQVDELKYDVRILRIERNRASETTRNEKEIGNVR